MSELCKWLHQQLEELPLYRYPFQLTQLPRNGIYFFYESDETWGHGEAEKPRIVRIGTHKDGNFQSRMSDHYLLKNEAQKMAFTIDQPAPKDRSIFRKNLGLALLNKRKDAYLKIWEQDFTTPDKRNQYKYQRNIATEQQVEREVTDLLRSTFSFRFIILEGEEGRMGSSGLESYLIGTVAKCGECRPSADWLGRYSPKPKIVNTGLWLIQHLDSPELTKEHQQIFVNAIADTNRWINVTNSR